MSGFDPYLIWLDIPPHERPATYYRLLGLRPLENDPQVIASSAQRVISHVARFQQSEHAAACTQLLAELTAARDCLLNPQRKQAYDSGFSQSFTSPIPYSSPTQQHASPERPLAGPASHAPTSAAPHLPTGGERQISHSPPVPQLPNQAPVAPATPHIPSPSGEAPINTPGVPQSVRPAPGLPQPAAHAPYQPYQPTQPVAPVEVNTPSPQHAYDTSVAQPASPQPAQPPAWATGQRTGEISTVVAGQQDPQTVDNSKTRKARQLRRAQQTQSAYMLVGIAMAMIVFFFGAVLLIAIFLGGK